MVKRLYHGSQDAEVKPEYGLGDERHDFGKGFYMTDSPELAREWSVYRPKLQDGYAQLRSLPGLRQSVRFAEHHASYEMRDGAARTKMRELIADPSFNRLERLFSDLVREIRQ